MLYTTHVLLIYNIYTIHILYIRKHGMNCLFSAAYSAGDGISGCSAEWNTPPATETIGWWL